MHISIYTHEMSCNNTESNKPFHNQSKKVIKKNSKQFQTKSHMGVKTPLYLINFNEWPTVHKLT